MADSLNDAPVYLDATLEPSQSLSRRGYGQVMLVMAGGAAVMGAYFLQFGFMPIIGFLAASVLVLWFAFRSSFRQQRQRTHVRVTAEALDLFHVDGRGREKSVTLPSAFARATVEEPDRETGYIRISASGKTYAIGRYLTADERAGFLRVLNEALANARAERHIPA